MTLENLTLGQYLRNEREIKGITLEQISSMTKIGIRTLHALEEDHYEELPASPFVRGFVTSYCRFIHINPHDVLKKFEKFFEIKNTYNQKEVFHSHDSLWKNKYGESNHKTILLFIILGFFLFSLFGLFILKPSLKKKNPTAIQILQNAHEKKEKQKLLTEESALLEKPILVDNSSPIMPVIPVIPVTQKKAGENPADPLDSGLTLNRSLVIYKLYFKVTGDIWVRYQVDDKPIREFVIRKGNILILRAEKTIALQISSPERVIFQENNKNGRSFLPTEIESLKKAGLFFGPLKVHPFENLKQLPLLP